MDTASWAEADWDSYFADFIANDPMIQYCITHAQDDAFYAGPAHIDEWELPAALIKFADHRRWVAWRGEPNPGKLPTKVPYRGTRRKASSTDSKTWLTLAEAKAVAHAIADEHGFGGGVGLVLGDLDDGARLIGIDLDSCRDPETGDVEQWAAEVIERFGSYTEVSPSKTGAKVFALVAPADLPAMQKILGERRGVSFKRSGGEHPPAIEVFTDGRYFAATGWRLGDAELRIIPVADFRWLVEEAGPSFVGKANGHDRSHDATRSHAAFRLGTALRRHGKTFEEMVDALRADPETAGWVKEKGERNGQRELRRIWDKVGDTDEVAALIERFNAKYFMVNEAGKAVIYQPGVDPGLKRRIFNRLSPRDFHYLYMNEEVQVGFNAKKKLPIFKKAADARSPCRSRSIAALLASRVAVGTVSRCGAPVSEPWGGFSAPRAVR